MKDKLTRAKVNVATLTKQWNKHDDYIVSLKLRYGVGYRELLVDAWKTRDRITSKLSNAELIAAKLEVDKYKRDTARVHRVRNAYRFKSNIHRRGVVR